MKAGERPVQGPGPDELSMEIRPAKPADAAAIHALVQRAYEPYVPLIGLRPAPMDDDYSERVARGQASVVEDASEIVGVLVLVPMPDHLLIENVAVDPDRHGEGIGRGLLSFAEAAAREAGLSELRLYTHVKMTRNLALYPRLGYVETHRKAESSFERVFFSKRL